MYFKHNRLCFTELSVIIILQCVVTLIGAIVCDIGHTLDEAIVLTFFRLPGSILILPHIRNHRCSCLLKTSPTVCRIVVTSVVDKLALSAGYPLL